MKPFCVSIYSLIINGNSGLIILAITAETNLTCWSPIANKMSVFPFFWNTKKMYML